MVQRWSTGIWKKSSATVFCQSTHWSNHPLLNPLLLRVRVSLGKKWSLTQTRQSVTAWSCQSPPAAMWIALELVSPEHGWRAEVTYHIFGRRRGLRKNSWSGEWDYSHSPWRTSLRSSAGAFFFPPHVCTFKNSSFNLKRKLSVSCEFKHTITSKNHNTYNINFTLHLFASCHPYKR